MKIIANTENGCLIEARTDELANLVGYYSKYDGDFRQLKIGDEINVSAMYSQLYKMKSHEKELTSASKQLQLIAQNINLINPVISEIMEEKNA